MSQIQHTEETSNKYCRIGDKLNFNFKNDIIIPEVMHVVTKMHVDNRGWFKEVYSSDHFDIKIGPFPLVCMSETKLAGAIRGLHFQVSPHSQGKLVSCLQGSIFDVAIDIRPASMTFGKWTFSKLSAENNKMLWIPPNFAHGFQTLERDTKVLYFCSDTYKPELERTITPFDENIAIEWPLEVTEIKDRDKNGDGILDLVRD